ncbi:hypothetical protein [Nocardioides convexus]|uniref:hypothetical protein n=1 Tax=Nocardioides convexus TaxID=2712224 RepID=UPI002418BBF6|nr:hypothetical protein [Nocardioides convexus]
MAMTAMEPGPRLPRAHRPLAAAQGRPRAVSGAAEPPTRRRRGRQRAPRRGRLPAAAWDRGRHPRRRRARPVRGDAGAGSTYGSPACTPRLQMEPEQMTRRMVAAVRNPFTNVLGHCTGRLVTGNRGTRAQSRFDARAVFEACAEEGVAVEINSRPERRDPPTKSAGVWPATSAACSPSTPTPTHRGSLDYPLLGCERAEAAGIDADRIVNTWPVERLLTWANP